MTKLLAALLASALFCATTAFDQPGPNDHDLELLKDRLLGSNRVSFTHGNHTYEISSYKENWYKAKYYCKWMGMELVSVETAEEQAAIHAVIEGYEEIDLYYISLNDNDNEGDYYWESTGQRIGPYSNYDNFEPTSGREENCINMVPTTGLWRSSMCDDSWLYICESTDDACNC